jgi:O-antigen ligase
MSAWSGALDGLAGRRPFATVGGGGLPRGGLDARLLAGLVILAGLLVGEGMALAHSYLWAAPLAALLLIAAAVDLPLVPFVGLVLLARVLTDDMASATSRHSGALNPSAAIAAILILVAIGLLVYRCKGLVPSLAIALGLGIWMAVAVESHGASTVTIREGVRELSIVAVAVIGYNARRALDLPTVARIVQAAGIIAALLAIFQLATHSGVNVGGDVRSNGTFAHPNDAAVFFAIAATASLWRFTDVGHKRLDAALAGVFALATLSTFSIDGFLTLLVMITAFGMLRPGSRRIKVRAAAIVGVLALAFLFSPVGSERLAGESGSEAGAAQAGARQSSSSLSWRFYKWKTLIPEWERSPYLGKGLGTTVTTEATAQSTTAGNLPHSEYVRYLVETGIVGFAALAAGMVMLIRRLNRGRRLAVAQGVAILALALIAGLLVNALAANTLLYTPAAYAAALIVGVSLRTVNAARDAERRRPRALAAR